MLDAASLIAPPDGVEAARAAAARLDAALALGVTRLDEAARAELEGFAAALSGSPLAEPVQAAVRGVLAQELHPHHFVALAAGRSALEGAVADALFAQAAAACGLEVEACAAAEPAALPAGVEAPLASAQQWLVEIALTGFAQLEAAAVEPVLGTLHVLEGRPELGSVARLITGFVTELATSVPTSALGALPVRRWADLWCAAILGTHAPPEVPAGEGVQADFTPIGASLRHHENAVSLIVPGALAGRWVHTTVNLWRVDAISGEEIWRELEALAPHLVEALVTPRALRVDTTLRGPHLAWPEAVEVVGPASPFELEPPTRIAPLPARQRHSVQIGIPVVLPECKVSGEAVAWDGGELPLDRAGTSPHVGLDDAALARADGLTALLRYDAGFRLQPLAARGTKGKKVFLEGPPSAIVAARKSKTGIRAVLAERASKLLRG